MAIATCNIKKALVSEGDVSAFVPALRRALTDPPVTSVASLGFPTAIPEPTALLRDIDDALTSVVTGWATGKKCKIISN